MIKLNGEEVEIKTFPNGESMISTGPLPYIKRTGNTVSMRYTSDVDLIHLMFLKRHMDKYTSGRSRLVIEYMPYSRMDRDENSFVFTLKYVCDFINTMKFAVVLVREAHSDVCLALLDNSYNIPTSFEIFRDNVIDAEYVYYPDSGAYKKYNKLFTNMRAIIGIKTRNFQTGLITELKVIGDDDLQGKKVVMIDDLCSYGGTFIMAAKHLKKRNAGSIELVVAHCEESILKGLIPDSGDITKVWTTDSIIQDNNGIEKIKIIKLEETI